jgi:voltage-gated potassium channel
MEADSFHPKHKSLTGLNIVSMLMSVYVIIAVIIEFLFEITPQLIRLLHIADAFVCLIFILDFIVNLKKAESKKHY